MTYLDVLFRYATPPSERAMRAMDAVREVYGIRRIEFNETEILTVRVEFDASRLSDDVVAKLLKQTGLDVRENSRWRKTPPVLKSVGNSWVGNTFGESKRRQNLTSGRSYSRERPVARHFVCYS